MWYTKKKWRRFFRYTSVGAATFLFDLLLLYIAVSVFGISYVIATPCAFLVAVSINYFVSRRFVFRGTTRSLHTGYLHFTIVAFAGAALTTFIVAELVSWLSLHYLLSRILAACVIGIGNYLFNLHLNFKVVGYHHGSPEED